jgi:DNA-binding HxlR family transcriptional regulator
VGDEIRPFKIDASEKAVVERGLVERTAHASLVPKVEYSLTQLGSKLISLIAHIARWGLQNLKDPEF